MWYAPEAPLRTFGLGYDLIVNDDAVEVKGDYDETVGLVGDGTENNPYRINCDDDMLRLATLVNKDDHGEMNKEKFFRQTCHIDMREKCTDAISPHTQQSHDSIPTKKADPS